MYTLPHVQLLGKQELMWLDKRAQFGGGKSIMSGSLLQGYGPPARTEH